MAATLNLSYYQAITHSTPKNNTNCKICYSTPKLQPLFIRKQSFFHGNLQIRPGNSGNVQAVLAMASGNVKEVLPPALDSSSDPPAIFDGTPKLYISYSCPFAQRAWITRNCKVPSLEHNNEVKGESLDLIRYIDSNFEGPSLFPDDPAKIEFAEELLSFTGSFSKAVISSLEENKMNEAGAAFDDIETALSKFGDGPFFLGQFSLVDIAYVPFIERYKPYFSEVKNYDITRGRPKFAVWIEEMNKIEGYKQTQRDPKEHIETYKKRFSEVFQQQ
ncbi:hypothetical protein RD792_007937 [Penstemon davidsonii]|uniref:GST N-terminal domain-containing protein n=1 Tax=Penstemon davidsonii TaxID=160366 RepID=A0ABR0D7Q5_9LAMI|nr:hypothetical protein RD792_007937 [Penstemon davidsonii]